jgi:4-amino-4-deoxy-L-arabinose transferase-like glycosyltransferase
MLIPPARYVFPAAIFATALGLRLTATLVLGDLPISRTPQLDSSAYLGWAGALVNNGSFWPVYPEHGPGYPIFLSIVLAAFDGSLTAVRIVQSIVGAIGCVLIARVASRTLTPRAYLPAGLLLALYGPQIYIDTALLAEGLFIFLLILGLDLATPVTGRMRAFTAGLVLGLATIVRPTALVVVIAFGIVLLLTRIRRHATGLQLAAGFVAGALVVIAPVVVKNWRVTGVPMVQAYGGMNFFLGNRPTGNGMASARPGGEWDALEGEASRFGYGRNEQDAYYFRKTFEAIGAAPGAYAQLVGSKLLWAVQAEELRDTHSYHFFADALPLLKWLPGFGVVLALACVGLVRSSGRGRRWLLVYLGATLVTIVLLVVGTRYRLPLLPGLIALAGAGIAGIVDEVRARRWRDVAMLAAIAAVVWALAHARTDAASRNLAEEWAMTGLSLLQESRPEDAENA